MVSSSTSSSFSTYLWCFFLLLGVILLCSLGKWQLSRSHEKALLLEQQATSFHHTPLNNTALLALSSFSDETLRTWRFQPVRLSGNFLADFTLLLDNKTHRGQVGYHVFVPFQLTEGPLVLINRGWIPQGASRHLPSLSPLHPQTLIEGYLDLPYQNRFIHQMLDSPTIQWPLRIQTLDLSAVSSLLQRSIFPMVVTLAPYTVNALQMPDSLVPLMSPERHLGYAFQWFTLALLLLLGGVWKLCRKKQS